MADHINEQLKQVFRKYGKRLVLWKEVGILIIVK